MSVDLLKPGFLANETFDANSNLYPESFCEKNINYYIFEQKEEKYYKNGEEKVYYRTTRVDKTESVNLAVQSVMNKEVKCLKHSSDVKNISTQFPIIKETFQGRYVELDFPENLAMKLKFEVQEAHFSGKQCTLHCGIVEPGETKCVYHLCYDTTHDATFVHFVLEDVFESRNIKNENVLIKSDNAPTQYKNKYAFKLLQSLANKYVAIVRAYGAAGHGKGLLMPCQALV